MRKLLSAKGLEILFASVWTCWAAEASESAAAATHFRDQVRPLLEQYCFDCHADGSNKGGIAFDELKTDSAILDHQLWQRVLKNVRAGLMPPEKKPRPSAEEQQR